MAVIETTQSESFFLEDNVQIDASSPSDAILGERVEGSPTSNIPSHSSGSICHVGTKERLL
ncbi:hypothetical protein Pyn_37588 [Prunus yedoensis var. nudiflora]|uniref:Uncharacterized protein n=1 Tax=Prunus yedoensis var. nudiflora TaxID=2094558 RepID=A0A314Y309_PRUYE|nr:hypothetical protein Pyn_37588 [Prunus yedoensis var. nudiflora]